MFGLERLPTYLPVLIAVWEHVKDVDLTSPRSVVLMIGVALLGVLALGFVHVITDAISKYSKKFVEKTYQVWLLLALQSLAFVVFAPADIKERAWAAITGAAEE